MGTRVRRRYVELRLQARFCRWNLLCRPVLRSIRGKGVAPIVEPGRSGFHVSLLHSRGTCLGTVCLADAKQALVLRIETEPY